MTYYFVLAMKILGLDASVHEMAIGYFISVLKQICRFVF